MLMRNLPFLEMERKLCYSNYNLDELCFDFKLDIRPFHTLKLFMEAIQHRRTKIKYSLAVIEWQIRIPCTAIFGTRLEMTDINSNNGYIAF